jgi:catechol 2,3-dioxygenase-like lactoylglutathione lyase family enzyme
MAVHHIAVATRDLDATHHFYTEAMGFDLVKTIVGATESGKGWAKHVFYETNEDDTYIAFWDLHDDTIPDTWSPAISRGLGLPVWVNHLAFKATSLDDMAARRQRWLDKGHIVSEIDHGFCVSIYTMDPNGILVEFCCTTVPFTQDDKDEARRLLEDPAPPMGPNPEVKVYMPETAGAPAGD